MFITSIAPEPEREDILRELGVTEEELRHSISVGDSARLMCTRHHPKITPGFAAWSETVRELRDILVPKGWFARSRQNFETVESAAGEIAICVVSGGPGTGMPGQSPKIKNPKGPVTVAVVERNHEQLSLFGDELGNEDQEAGPLNSLTWFLLTYAYGNKVFCELSLPATMANGQVQSWSKRILLGPLERDAQFVLSPADDEPDIDIDITRKAN